jgi:hypothetical protein
VNGGGWVKKQSCEKDNSKKWKVGNRQVEEEMI